MKNIIINIGSDLFDGFYESIHCNSDEFIDVEMESARVLNLSHAFSNFTSLFISIINTSLCRNK